MSKFQAILSASILIVLSACSSADSRENQPAAQTGTGSSAAAEDFPALLARAEAGDADAQFEVGALYHDGSEGVTRDLQKSREWFEKAADKGEVRSQFNLGVIYYTGEGVPQDFKVAERWFSVAAAKGNPRAQFNLGIIYYRGKTGKQDYRKAADLFTRSAMQGFAESQFNLGVMNVLGEGFERDVLKAYSWFKLAEKPGHPKAAEALAQIEGQLAPVELTDAKKQADDFVNGFSPVLEND